MLSVGIVGLPNVGKSTLFNALLKRQAALAANYPFATIDPNTGIVPVPDRRLEILAQVVNTKTIKPATVEFVDIAGLVKGAAAGEGLGNQFLAHIRETQLICHVVRGFTDPDIIREGSTDPVSDVETIETELLLADLATLEKQKAPKATKEPELLKRWAVVERLQHAARAGQPLRLVAQTEEEQQVAKELGLLTAKTMIYVVNVDETIAAQHTELASQYAEQLKAAPENVLVISAKIESELSSLSDEDQALFLAELGLSESGLERVISRVYSLLGLQSFLTAGELEVRAWTIKAGMRAPEAAGAIHTDFTKKFIKANVADYQDFIELGGWKAVREKGRLRIEGKEYVMQPNDVVEFMIGS
ncbi:redox-regulated ATPase YchF [Candidatus Woesebacteria bacterium]|nr:redox-regulated ATPase YchF [Candidatus Woesebacteria bacterium]